MNYLFLFDLDNTLFDSASYRKNIFTKIVELCSSENNSITVEFLQDVYNRQIKKNGLFEPEIFLQEVFTNKVSDISLEKLTSLIYDPEVLHEYLHSDVLSTFKTLSQIGEIGIFSQGESKLQNAKITKLHAWLSKDKIHIAVDKKAQLKKVFIEHKDFSIYFIDDMLPILHKAKKIYPKLTTIWIKRGKYAETQLPIPDFIPDATVHTLHEVVDFITSRTT